jgi:hypothetical protein
MDFNAQTLNFTFFKTNEKCCSDTIYGVWGVRMARFIKFAGFKVRVPAHRIVRTILGIALVFGGIFSFLPVLGVWMLPLGLIMLSIDSALVRKFRRKSEIRLGRWLLRRWPNFARRIGFGGTAQNT